MNSSSTLNQIMKYNQSKIMTSTNDEEFFSPKFKKKEDNLIPKVAYYYIPSKEEQVLYNPEFQFKSKRYIFEGRVIYLPFESEKLIEFSYFIKKYPLPEYISEANILRNLQSNEFNIRQAYSKILDNLLLREKKICIGSLYSPQMMEILNSGYIYFHGRDNRFRPNLIIRIKMITSNFKKYDYSTWSDTIMYLLDFCVFNMLIPGRVENFNMILDMENFSVYTTPNEMKSIMSLIQNNYPCRLYRFYIVNSSSLGSIFFNIIQNYWSLDNLLIVENNEDLFNYINKSQIEKKYGGTAENIEIKFFPPSIVSHEYFVKGDKVSELLMKEEKFQKLYPDLEESEMDLDNNFEYKNGNYFMNNEIYNTKPMDAKSKTYQKEINHNLDFEIKVIDRPKKSGCMCDDSKCIIM